MTDKAKEEFLPQPLGMSEDEANREFDRLQAKLAPLWTSIRSMNQDEQTIVVVPSINVDSGVSGVRQQALEERFLFLLLLLRQPRARLIYVTSQAIHPDVIDYYLDLLPGVFAGHARKRLFLSRRSTDRALPLTEKLLARPQLLEHIRSLIPDPDRAHLVPYNTTETERDLAIALGHPDVRRRSAHVSSRHQERLRARSSAKRACRTRSASRTCKSPDEMVDAIVDDARSRSRRSRRSSPS